jgi:hypothetical protein
MSSAMYPAALFSNGKKRAGPGITDAPPSSLLFTVQLTFLQFRNTPSYSITMFSTVRLPLVIVNIPRR